MAFWVYGEICDSKTCPKNPGSEFRARGVAKYFKFFAKAYPKLYALKVRRETAFGLRSRNYPASANI